MLCSTRCSVCLISWTLCIQWTLASEFIDNLKFVIGAQRKSCFKQPNLCLSMSWTSRRQGYSTWDEKSTTLSCTLAVSQQRENEEGGNSHEKIQKQPLKVPHCPLVLSSKLRCQIETDLFQQWTESGWDQQNRVLSQYFLTFKPRQ